MHRIISRPSVARRLLAILAVVLCGAYGRSAMRARLALIAALLVVVPVWALDGDVGLHDPSTMVRDGSRFYAYATGGGLPMSVSDDGWTWRRAGTRDAALPGGKPGPDVIARGGNNTWAPDVIRVGDKYFLYYSAPGTQPKSAIGLLVGKTLDPDVAGLQVGGRRPGGLVRRRRGQQRDRSRRVSRSDERFAVAHLRFVLRLHPSRRAGSEDRQAAAIRDRKPVNIAINSEASIMIFRDGWYYLLRHARVLLRRARTPATTSAWAARGR